MTIVIHRYLIAMQKHKQFYKINFGYTQVLFMGSVPRINCLLVIVPFKGLYIKHNNANMTNKIKVFQLYLQEIISISHQLPYTLILVKSYPITSNSKAA